MFVGKYFFVYKENIIIYICVIFSLITIIEEYSSLYYVYVDENEIKTETAEEIIEEYSGECMSYFISAAFSPYFDRGLMRWEKENVFVGICGDNKNSDILYLRKAINLVNNSLLSIKFIVVDTCKFNTDIKLFFLNKAPINNSVFGKCATFCYGSTNEIKEAVIFIYNIKNKDIRNRVIMHEFLHSIGFKGHPKGLFDYTHLSDIYLMPQELNLNDISLVEREGIKLLYDKRLPKYYSRKSFYKQFTLSPVKKNINLKF